MLWTLSGLTGMPLAGNKGWKSLTKKDWGIYGAKRPEDGHYFVVFGPHIGIDSNGVIG